MTAAGARFNVSPSATKRLSGGATISPSTGCEIPQASFSNSVTPEVFSPITPIIAPDGATARNPVRGGAETFLNSIDIQKQHTGFCTPVTFRPEGELPTSSNPRTYSG